MKAHSAHAGSVPTIRSLKRYSLKPRTSYPGLSVVPLHRSPLRKLAWILGFGR